MWQRGIEGFELAAGCTSLLSNQCPAAFPILVLRRAPAQQAGGAAPSPRANPQTPSAEQGLSHLCYSLKVSLVETSALQFKETLCRLHPASDEHCLIIYLFIYWWVSLFNLIQGGQEAALSVNEPNLQHLWNQFNLD